MKPITSTTAPLPLPLSPAEVRWLAAWRTMDNECRYQNLILMEGQARRHPRHTQPALRLIVGGVR